jgi:flagellar motor switch protein FliG
MSDLAQTLPAPYGAALPAAPEPSLSAIQKAAIILTAIGPDLAANVLKDVSEYNLRRFAAATASLGVISQEMLDQVIVEFLGALTSGGDLAGGAEAARRLLAGILEDDQINEFLGDAASRQSVWERMATAPVAALAAYVGNEHPQTAAVILSELKSDVAATVLERLNQGFAREIVLRLSRVPTIDRRTNEALSTAIERDFLSALQRSLSKRRPADMIAGLMNNISSEAREAFLVHLEETMPELAQDVQRSMFTFDDIATRLAAKDIGLLVRELPEEVLMPALKFGQMQGSDSVGFILENLPRRLAERYVEDLAMMDDVSRKEGEASHIELTKFVLARQKAGQIAFLDRDEG